MSTHSVDYFQSLLSLEIARTNFMKLNGDDLVKDVLENFFIDQGMDRTFGLGMLQRHFDLEPGEMPVDYEGASITWNADHASGMKPPQPAIWAVSSDGDFRPTEFYITLMESIYTSYLDRDDSLPKAMIACDNLCHKPFLKCT